MQYLRAYRSMSCNSSPGGFGTFRDYGLHHLMKLQMRVQSRRLDEAGFGYKNRDLKCKIVT